MKAMVKCSHISVQKDGGLCFYIDFHNENARTKKDSYPLSWMQGAIESLVGVE